MALDLDRLIAPISEAVPCGPDLRGEPDFRDIEDAPGEFAAQTPAELRKTVAKCVEFLERTHDQMPAIIAVQASIRAGDYSVANDALLLIKAFGEQYWEDFHPGPAEEMAVGRVNELSALSRPAAMILPLQRAGIAKMPPPSTVEFTSAMLAQVAAPVLEWSTADETALGAKITSGALSSVAAKSIKSTHEGARLLRAVMRSIVPSALAADIAAGAAGGDDSVDSAQAATIAMALRTQVSAAGPPLKAMSDVLYDIMATYDGHSIDSPSFGPVIAQLKSIDSSIEGFLAGFPDPTVGGANEEGEVEATGDPALGAAGPAASARPRAFVADTPRSRADVRAAIDAICRFYDESEPSSPVPLMLRRVCSWVNKDFIELMREIAPNAVEEATRLLAIKSE